MDNIAQTWRVETRTTSSTLFAVASSLVVALAVVAPFFVTRGTVQNLFFILTMLVLAQCWNMLAGFAGLVSVGQQAFVGFGAYAMFALVVLFKLDPLVAIMLAGLVAVPLAALTSTFLFRLHGAYFAIGSWVIAEVVRLLLAQWKALGGGTGTSLPTGVTRDMWGVGIVGHLFGLRPAQATDVACYWLALAAVRDNDEAARSIGVDARWLKTFVYLAAAFLTALAGALIYVQKARISPDAAFSVVDWTAYVIFIVVIGGIGTIEGPMIGVLVFFLLQTTLADYGSWYLLVLGLIGIAVMLFAPRGLWGLFTSRTGIQLFPVRRMLRGGPLSITCKGGQRG